MFNSMTRILPVMALCLLSVGCGSSGSQEELRDYIREVKSRPPGMIEPMPTFRPYEAFVYSAAAKRSPFDQPVEEKQRVLGEADADLKPDLSREKEFLESFDLNALTMVGTLERNGTLWALISDGSGGIHRITTDRKSVV